MISGAIRSGSQHIEPTIYKMKQRLFVGGKYGTYEIIMSKDFEWVYEDNEGKIPFFFELAAVRGNDINISKDTNKGAQSYGSERHETAFARVMEHIKSLKLRTRVFDDADIDHEANERRPREHRQKMIDAGKMTSRILKPGEGDAIRRATQQRYREQLRQERSKTRIGRIRNYFDRED